jgi:hypothetical protein
MSSDLERYTKSEEGKLKRERVKRERTILKIETGYSNILKREGGSFQEGERK